MLDPVELEEGAAEAERRSATRRGALAGLESVLLAQGRNRACWLPVGLGLGAAGYFALPFEPLLADLFRAALCAVVPALALLVFGWGRVLPRVLGAALLSLAAGGVGAALQTRSQAPMPALPSYGAYLHGRVVAVENVPPRPGREGRRRLVLAEGVFETPFDEGMNPLRRQLRVTLKKDDPTSPEIGGRIRLRAMLYPPSPPSWPGGRDFRREAWFSGLAGSGYALSWIEPLRPPPALSPVRERLRRLRSAVAYRIAAALPGQRGAIAATLLCGETSALSLRTRQDFAASGLAHLLAVAGLHLGFVMVLTGLVLRSLLALSERAALTWPCREIALLAALIAGLGYVFLTGAHLPSLRAIGMAAIATLAVLTGRRALSMRSLAIVALGFLLLSPVSVLDLSLQMSLCAVMGLIAGYESVREPLRRWREGEERWRKAGLYLLMLALTSLLAGLATLPVSMAHFGAFQPWFVLANIVAVPLMGVWIMPMGLLSLAAMLFHAEKLFLTAMGGGIAIVQWLAQSVSALPFASVAVPAMPGWGLCLVLLGLCVLCLWRGRLRAAGLLLLSVGVAAIWLVPRPVLLLSSDAGLMAVRQNGALLVGPHTGRERWALEAWRRAFAFPLGALPSSCTQKPCRLTIGGRDILLRPHDATDGRLLPDAASCRGVVLFVSASPARRACPGVPYLDRFSAWRDGAWAVYPRAGGGFRLVSDRRRSGRRLWVPRAGSRGTPTLPLAKEE